MFKDSLTHSYKGYILCHFIIKSYYRKKNVPSFYISFEAALFFIYDYILSSFDVFIHPVISSTIVNSIKKNYVSICHFHCFRGSYLACIVYCEDKVLVTTEEFPPVVEVDDDYMGQAKSHFHWLLKVNFMKE